MAKTRNSSKSEIIDESKFIKTEVDAVKVFILHKDLLLNSEDLIEIQLLKLRNPATECGSYYAIDKGNKNFYQLIQFNQPNRSFFINDLVNSNGKFYITQPLDIKFLFLYYIRKYASKNAIAIDQIDDPEFSVTIETLSKYANKDELKIICDVKDYSKDLFFVKYNENRALAWLSLVTKKICNNIKAKHIYAGGSGAQSANFEKSSFLEEKLNDEKILLFAWGIIGTFLTEDLHLELANYLNVEIPKPKSIKEVGSTKNGKRKTLEESADMNKKIKMDIDITFTEPSQKPKEKIQTTKEKQMAKAASGTKNIMSFFKK